MALHPSALLSSTRVLDYEPFVQKMCSQTFVLDLGLNTFPSRFFLSRVLNLFSIILGYRKITATTCNI